MTSPALTRRVSPSVVLLGASLCALACSHAAPSRAAEAPDGSASPAPAPAPATAADSSVQTPGVDTSKLSPSAKRELQTVLTDEFCYCGCPHTVGACLLEHRGCRHAKRMTQLAAALANDGVAGVEIIAALSKYHQSFREARHVPKLDPRQCKGNPEAKITVVEYADFECPFCGAARPMLEQFAEQNAAKVRFCYAPFPLQMHPNALTAGQAALFARDHGKFWELHTLMFEHQEDLSPAAVRTLAESVGLDGAALAKAVSSGKYLDELEASKAAGKEAGVTGTPSLLVNGRRFTLGISNDLLTHTVDDELEWLAGGQAWVRD